MTIVEELSNVIASRNEVDTNSKSFTAEDVAEYLILYRNHIVVSGGNPYQAMEELFGNK